MLSSPSRNKHPQLLPFRRLSPNERQSGLASLRGSMFLGPILRARPSPHFGMASAEGRKAHTTCRDLHLAESHHFDEFMFILMAPGYVTGFPVASNSNVQNIHIEGDRQLHLTSHPFHTAQNVRYFISSGRRSSLLSSYKYTLPSSSRHHHTTLSRPRHLLSSPIPHIL